MFLFNYFCTKYLYSLLQSTFGRWLHMHGSTLVTANVTTFLMCFSNIRGNCFFCYKVRIVCYNLSSIDFFVLYIKRNVFLCCNSPSDVSSAYVAFDKIFKCNASKILPLLFYINFVWHFLHCVFLLFCYLHNGIASSSR